MSYNSFVYDIGVDIQGAKPLRGFCVVAFRPQPTWDGSVYGFDWIRVSDSGQPGDMLYADNMGEYLTATGERINMIPRFLPEHHSDFVKNPHTYKNMIDDYFKSHDSILWKKPVSPFICTDSPNALLNDKGKQKSRSTLNSERKDHIKRIKKEAEYTYFTPIMTLMKDKEANLQLVIEFMKDKPKPLKIEIIADDPEKFEIKANIDPNNNSTFRCSIKALETFSDSQCIRAQATYAQADGNEIVDCGRLIVLKNRLKGIVNINCFTIRLLKAGKEINRTFSDTKNDIIELTSKFLNQAMLELNIIKYPDNNIDIDKPTKHPQYWTDTAIFSHVLNSDYSAYINSPLAFCTYSIQSEFIKPFFEKTKSIITATFNDVAAKLMPQQALPALTTDVITKFQQFVNKISIWNACRIGVVEDFLYKFDNEICIFFLDRPHNGNTLGISSKNLNAIYYSHSPSETTAHEICHSLDLAHSFACRIDNVEKSDRAKYSYRALITDNLMDYSDNSKPIKKTSTWRWQWEIMWNKVNEIKENTPAKDSPIKQELTDDEITNLRDKAQEMDEELKKLQSIHLSALEEIEKLHSGETEILNSSSKISKKDQKNIKERQAKERKSLIETQQRELILMIDKYEASIIF